MTENKKKIEPETYDFDQVKRNINKHLKSIKSSYDFIRLGKMEAFKHYKDKELYHFGISAIVDLDEAFTSSRYNAKKMAFPIGFDIDVEHSTRQYVDYVLSGVFDKLNDFLAMIKFDYKMYKQIGQDNKNDNVPSGIV